MHPDALAVLCQILENVAIFSHNSPFTVLLINDSAKICTENKTSRRIPPHTTKLWERGFTSKKMACQLYNISTR